MPRRLTAVPVARSSPKSLKIKQGLVIGALIAAALTGPFALLTRPSFPVIDVNGPANQIAVETIGPLALLGAADEYAQRFVLGGRTGLVVAQGVALSEGGLGGTDPVRISWRRLTVREVGLDASAYSQAVEVSYLTSRQGKGLVVSVVVAQSTPVEGRGGWPVLVNEPSIRDYLEVSQPTPPMALAIPGWETDPTTDTAVVRQLLERWADAWASDDASVLDDPAGPVLHSEELSRQLAKRRSRDGDNYRPFYGLGGFEVSSLVYTTPQRRATSTPGATDERMVRVRFDLKGEATTVNTVTATLDILLSPQTNKVLAWGPAGSGGPLSPLTNHTLNRLPAG